MQLARQTVAPCSADGYNVSASVVDRFGVLLAMVRADGAGPHTAEASHAKTFTSASSRNPTSGLAKAIQSNPDAAGMANIPGFLVLGGGVPLKIGNETLVPLVPLAWPVRLAAIWTSNAPRRRSTRCRSCSSKSTRPPCRFQAKKGFCAYQVSANSYQ